MTDTNVQSVVPFLNVSDMERSLRYYLEGLGFSIKHQWMADGKVRWCWLVLGGGALMLQEFRTEGNNSWVPAGKVGEGVTLYFICTDALAIYQEALSRGIQLSEPEVANGMWVTGVNDPDGYRLFFESPTETPEDTRLSELKAEE